MITLFILVTIIAIFVYAAFERIESDDYYENVVDESLKDDPK